jgi:hypothetical protein
VICGLEQMVKDDVMKNSKCYVDRKGCHRSIHDKFEVLFVLEKMREEDVMTKFDVIFE